MVAVGGKGDAAGAGAAGAAGTVCASAAPAINAPLSPSAARASKSNVIAVLPRMSPDGRNKRRPTSPVSATWKVRRVIAPLLRARFVPILRHKNDARSHPMTQTNNRFFDEVARLMNDAAGVATGVRREFDTVMRTQAERVLRDLEVVQREEFEAVKEMARLAREENEALKARIAALEGRVGTLAGEPP